MDHFKENYLPDHLQEMVMQHLSRLQQALETVDIAETVAPWYPLFPLSMQPGDKDGR
ncbi:MAG: hypothetical protein OWS74_03015 [Firmicutes bacterium]|nr:hypothetical protein [Bacillota bacterium]